MHYEQISALNGVLWVVIPCSLVDAYHILEASAHAHPKQRMEAAILTYW